MEDMMKLYKAEVDRGGPAVHTVYVVAGSYAEAEKQINSSQKHLKRIIKITELTEPVLLSND